MASKGLLGLTALMLAALAVLDRRSASGSSQRLQWKEGLIAQIESAHQGPLPSPSSRRSLRRAMGAIRAITACASSGRFHHAKERYLYAVSEGEPGWDVITPLETADGEMVLVDRGFVPDELKDPSSRALRPGRARRRRHRARAPARDAGSVHPRQRARRQSLVLARPRRHGGARCSPRARSRSRPSSSRPRRATVPGGWPEGGQTRLEHPQQPSAICHHLVPAGRLPLGVYAVYVWKRLPRGGQP